MSSPESVSSRIARRGSSIDIWRISLRFFSPPEKPALTERLRNAGSMSSRAMCSLARPRNSTALSSGRPSRGPERVHRGAQEVHVADAGDLDGVLEGEEHAGGGPFLGCQGKQIDDRRR